MSSRTVRAHTLLTVILVGFLLAPLALRHTLAGTAAAAGPMSITDLGSFVDAYSINDAGQVVGQSNEDAFLWSASGGMIDLGKLGGSDSQANGIDNGGQIVGTTGTRLGVGRAFLWTVSTGMQDLGSLNDSNSYGYGINDADQVVGWTIVASGTHAFLWSAGTGMTDLGTLPGGTFFSTAYAINASGQVVGQSNITSNIGPNIGHAFLWSAGSGMQDLGTLGGTNSTARSINTSGHVVGFADIGAGQHAFLWSAGGGMKDLGTLPGYPNSEAYAINDSGQIVGDSSNTSGGSSRATLWSASSGPTDLNTLLPANSGWVLTEARAINNKGQIVGSGTLNGQTHGFLLTPGSAVTPTNTPTDTPTDTPIPGNRPTNTPVPGSKATNTPVPASKPTNTPTPVAPTSVPWPASCNKPGWWICLTVNESMQGHVTVPIGAKVNLTAYINRDIHLWPTPVYLIITPLKQGLKGFHDHCISGTACTLHDLTSDCICYESATYMAYLIDEHTNKIILTSNQVTVTWQAERVACSGKPGNLCFPDETKQAASADAALIVIKKRLPLDAGCFLFDGAKGWKEMLWCLTKKKTRYLKDLFDTADFARLVAELQIALDPPDPHFTVIATPHKLVLPHVVPPPGFKEEAAEAAKLADNEAQVVGLERALVISVERVEGAAAAGNAYWVAQQARVARKYAAELEERLDAEPKLYKKLRRALEDGRMPRIIVTAAQVRAFQNAVATHGLPPVDMQALVRAGATSTMIDRLRRLITTLDPTTAAGSFPACLTDPALTSATLRFARAMHKFAESPPEHRERARDRGGRFPENLLTGTRRGVPHSGQV